MKYVIVLADGMSDRPISSLGGKTPLEVANTPNMDLIARKGRCGLLKTLYPGLPHDSGVANMTILGYDARSEYPGRAPLEAGNLGVDLGPSDVAFRCNLVSVEDDEIVDFTADHITTQEAKNLIVELDDAMGGESVEFYCGVSYRHILILRKRFSSKVQCTPPHDMIGEPMWSRLPKSLDDSAVETSKLLVDFTRKSRQMLENHSINEKRRLQGRLPANCAWFWGPGHKPKLESFKHRYGLDGSLISAVDLLKGLAKYVGLNSVDVEGATGYIDTNYVGKAEAALECLSELDFVYLHIESTDEAGHEGSIEHKVTALEDIDEKVLGTLLSGLSGDFRIAVLPDHATPVEVRSHVDDPVPYAIYDSTDGADEVCCFTEREIKEKGGLGLREGFDFMKFFLS